MFKWQSQIYDENCDCHIYGWGLLLLLVVKLVMCLFVFIKLLFVVFLVCCTSCTVKMEKKATSKAFLTSLMILFCFTFFQTVLQSLHLPKNNSLYVLTPDIAPLASTSQSRYVFVMP